MNKKFFLPDTTSSLLQWLNYISTLHYKNIDLNLDRVLTVATRLNLLCSNITTRSIILVGGTNGKGTTCYLLENILLSSGFRVGLYTSPHLLTYTERIRVQGKELPDIIHIEVMALIEEARGSISLSYFEFATLSALYLFKQSQLEIIILEVGLGGRLDATNIVDPDVSVITNIALDHTDLLGIDIRSIAREKSGILRYNKPAVIGEKLQSVILDIIAQRHALLFIKERDWWYRVEKKTWHWWTNNYILKSLLLPHIPLNNAATAIAAIRCLPLSISQKAIQQGLNNTIVLGRFQIINRQPLVILDVAHNPHAAKYLAKRLIAVHFTGKLRAVVGMLSHKNITKTLSYLLHLVDIWYCASIDTTLGACAEELAMKIDSNMIFQFKDVVSAWNQVIEDADVEDCILVFGSFYTVSPVLKLVCSKHIERC
ncbi:bifunctional tetrahydrofolate synthase/dihydrofolate synthase [Blochmannia endosymbiont of Camponotus (Colobopsis) obliquus]|uniref:bifunctional tetrahydrofolate synthase/dihydrofolate synthase n=1 Tax=Blochmannia endosymbiont of Camponotus (Colobopsis) obliquus TaxID=1505597 RepID=UPI00061A6685|nr:bifunctional tetrahydrofolate synthase/dihydrofolate synthase [Blochmannia endosymbiont of Camponotus (Colobopsis) obliquus]AKC60646.1 bifunctional protein folC [Blochmannia endosymbiont of Camponotus (Colobopsis) obliquus]